MKEAPCPVCASSLSSSDQSKCPQCGADLECFDLLGTLEEREGIESSLRNLKAELKKSARRYVIVLIVVIVAVAVALSRYQRQGLQSLREETQQEVEGARETQLREPRLQEVVTGITQLSQHLSRLEERMTAISKGSPKKKPQPDRAFFYPEPTKDETLWHEPTKNETLWRIAKKYYGRGALYPVLLETNPNLKVYFDPGDGKISILKDPRAAAEIFEALVFVKEGRRFFRYQLGDQDSWKKISERFYGHANEGPALKAQNEDVPLRPGIRVIVPLDGKVDRLKAIRKIIRDH